MVNRLREKPDASKVEVTIGDMSRVSTGPTYGMVYLVYKTIGNLLTQDDQIRCFENAAYPTTACSFSSAGSRLLPPDPATR